MGAATATVERPRRSEPHPYDIAHYWLDRTDASSEWPDFRGRYIDLGEPFCFRCGWLAPVGTDEMPASTDGDSRAAWRMANAWLDRAHLVDRSSDGLDGPQNLVMLCQLCHDLMPSFRTDEGPQALAWVKAGQKWPTSELWQLYNDELGRRGRLARLRPAWLRFLEVMVEAFAS